MVPVDVIPLLATPVALRTSCSEHVGNTIDAMKKQLAPAAEHGRASQRAEEGKLKAVMDEWETRNPWATTQRCESNEWSLACGQKADAWAILSVR